MTPEAAIATLRSLRPQIGKLEAKYLAALSRLETELARLTAERNEYAERLAWHREERDAYLKGNLWVKRAAEERERAEAALAEVTRLQEGLRRIATVPGTWQAEIATTTLAGGDVPATPIPQGEIASGVIAELTKTCEFWQAEVTRLREGLRRLKGEETRPIGPHQKVTQHTSYFVLNRRIDSLLDDNQEAGE